MTFRKSSASYDRHKIKQALLALSYIDNELCFNMCYPKEDKIYHFYPSFSEKKRWNVKEFSMQRGATPAYTMTTEGITRNSMVSIVCLAAARGAFLTFHDDASSMSMNISTLMKYLKMCKKIFER